MSQPNEILLNIELDSVATISRTQTQKLLHLLLGCQLLGVQVDGEAGQEAAPARGAAPQV